MSDQERPQPKSTLGDICSIPLQDQAAYEALQHTLENTPPPQLLKDMDWQEQWEARARSSENLVTYAAAHNIDAEPHIDSLLESLSGLHIDQLLHAETTSDPGLAHKSIETAHAIRAIVDQSPHAIGKYGSTELIVNSVCRAALLERTVWPPIAYVRRVTNLLARHKVNKHKDLDEASKVMFSLANNLIYRPERLDDEAVSFERAIVLFQAVEYLGPSEYDNRQDRYSERTASARIQGGIAYAAEQLVARKFTK